MKPDSSVYEAQTMAELEAWLAVDSNQAVKARRHMHEVNEDLRKRLEAPEATSCKGSQITRNLEDLVGLQYKD